MFDLLEELAAFYGYITDKQYLKCKNYGFVMEKQKAIKTNQMVECPKCGQRVWMIPSLLDEEL